MGHPRRLLATALAGSVVVAVPLVSRPSLRMVGGFDLDRVEDGLHLVAAALLTAVVGLLFRRSGSGWERTLVLVPVLVVLAGVEVAQMALPGRSASVVDLVLGLVGALVGVAAVARVPPAALPRARRDMAVALWAATVLTAVLVLPA